jgi:murein DD-endopeptidase MepM/ murein hydrolase activator NlpD
MKAKIVTRIPIKQTWLDEVASLIPGITFEVVKTDKQLTTYYKPEQHSMYCDFNSMRAIINDSTVAIRAFYMPYSELLALGVTNHLALYDNSDKDGILDFYVGLKDTLDARAKANGFKSNFAWEFIHEMLHGEEQNIGHEYEVIVNPDRTHAMEAKGQLVSLLQEDIVTIPKLQATVSMLMAQLKALILKQPMPPTTMLHPIPEQYKKNITQKYGVYNPEYPATLHHQGTDYACPLETSIFAPWQGQTIEVGNTPVLGNYCVYQWTFNGQTYAMRVLHQEKLPIKSTFKRGDIIGLSGNTGQSEGSHVHLDVWRNSVQLAGINAQNFKERTIDPELLFN